MKFRATTVIALVVAAGAAAADDPKPDLPFLVDASVLIHADTQYSQLAEDRASPTVAKFASQMLESHKQLHKELAAIVKDRKVGVVAGTEKEVREEKARLGELKGAPFDRAYLDRIAADHERLINMCESQVKNGKDADLTAFAKKALPELRKHLETAKGLAKGR
jgi:putative membrane protein